jgi:hypothetical protein
VTELLAKADHALFSAKGSGKDRKQLTNLRDKMPGLQMDG